MAITQICGLANIHRYTWYNRGIAYKLMQEHDSILYEPNEGVRIDAKTFLEEYEGTKIEV